MTREIIQLNTIPDFKTLIWNEEIWDDEENEPLYIPVKVTILNVDLEKCYKTVKVVFERTADNKFFSFEYNYSDHWDDSRCVGAHEVFPVEKTIIEYE